MSATGDQYSKLARYMIALVTGAAVFFPSISGAIRPPHILEWLVFLFWIASVVALGLLASCVYIAEFRNAAPHKTGGAGNIFAVTALATLVIYVGLNIVHDRISPPAIIGLDVPSRVSTDDQVMLTAEAVDQDLDALFWHWTVTSSEGDSTVLNGRGNSRYWTPGDLTPGMYRVRAIVRSDDNEVSLPAEASILVTGGKQMTDQDRIVAYVHDRVAAYAARLAREDSPRVRVIQEAEPHLVEIAHRNIRSLDNLLEEPEVLDEALHAYASVGLEELRSMNWRPCCSERPGFWPFCNPDC